MQNYQETNAYHRTCLNEHLNKEKTSDEDMSDYS